MSAQSPVRRKTVPDIRARKGGEPLVCLTAYDAPMAEILDPHCDVILVGDSLGMVVHGLPSTVGVTLDMMILHGRAVMRGSKSALVVIDLPFGSYESNPHQAFGSASRVLMETGAPAVKIESGEYAAETIAFLTERGIPVMAHVGLRPQSTNTLGGFKAQGRTDAERQSILRSAKAAEEAGAFSIVIEGVARDLAEDITQTVSVPTIGIGASVTCDGQILVTHDMLGLFPWTPKFVKVYGDMRVQMNEAVERWAADVRGRKFPEDSQTYTLKSSS